MKRTLYEELLRWKKNPYRKPLVLLGARQVGKTYLVTEFAESEFDDCIILNCDKDQRIREIFERDLQADRIISDIEILSGRPFVPGKTLLFFDEVGEVPRALAALKYFCEDAPEYLV